VRAGFEQENWRKIQMKMNLKLAPNLNLAHGAHEAYLTCDGKRLAHVSYETCGKCVPFSMA